MDDLPNDIRPRLAVLEMMFAHLAAEAAARDPEGPIAGLLLQVEHSKRPQPTVPEDDSEVMAPHADRLFRMAREMFYAQARG